MKNLARAAAVAATAIGIAAFAAPAASACAPVNIAIGDDDAKIVNQFTAHIANESGPGDLASHYIKDSKHLGLPTQNETTKFRDLKSNVSGKGNTAPVEVEGSEQDQGEGA